MALMTKELGLKTCETCRRKVKVTVEFDSLAHSYTGGLDRCTYRDCYTKHGGAWFCNDGRRDHYHEHKAQAHPKQCVRGRGKRGCQNRETVARTSTGYVRGTGLCVDHQQ